MWIEFIVGSCPCSKGFSLGPLVFLSQQNTNILNSNSTWQKWTRFFFCELPSMHALLCLGPVTTYILPGEGIGGFLLYHTEINLVAPPPKKKKAL